MPKINKPVVFPDSLPLVSIAVCSYNGAKFLQQQLDSLAGQDYSNFEIIIIDDCSSDSTFEILKLFKKDKENVKIFQNETNLGFVKNFEKAISLCSGDYIALCDQDDIWFPEKISKLVESIGSAGLVYSAVQLMDQDGVCLDEIFPRRNKLHGRCYMELLFSNCVTGHACLIRRAVLERALPFPEKIKVHDHWLAIVAATKEGIAVYDDVLSLYRRHDENVLLNNKKRDSGKTAKFKRKLQNQKDFLLAVLQLQDVPAADKALIMQIEKSLTPTVLRSNERLEKILKKHSERLFAVYPDPGKAIKKLCQPLWRVIL